MERYQLEYLVALSEYKTLLHTAEALHVSQPSITKAFQKLEDEFGFPLFTREKNRLSFNEYGQTVLEYAKRILDEMNEMEETVRTMYEANRVITLAGNAPAPLWGIRSLMDKKVRTVIVQDTEDLLDSFEKHAYSLIVLDYPVNDSRYVCRKICQEQLHVALRPDHELANREHVSFEDLDGLTILRRSNVGYWQELTAEFMPHSKFILEENEETYRILTQASNLPVFRTNLSLQQWKGQEDRVYIPITNPEATLSFYAIYDKRNQKSFDEALSRVDKIEWENFKAEEIVKAD